MWGCYFCGKDRHALNAKLHQLSLRQLEADSRRKEMALYPAHQLKKNEICMKLRDLGVPATNARPSNRKIDLLKLLLQTESGQ